MIISPDSAPGIQNRRELGMDVIAVRESFLNIPPYVCEAPPASYGGDVAQDSRMKTNLDVGHEKNYVHLSKHRDIHWDPMDAVTQRA